METLIVALIGGGFALLVFMLGEFFNSARTRKTRDERFLEYLLPERVKAHSEIFRRFTKNGFSQFYIAPIEPDEINRIRNKAVGLGYGIINEYGIIISANVYIAILDIIVFCESDPQDATFDLESGVSLSGYAAFKNRFEYLNSQVFAHCRKDIGSNAVDNAVKRLKGEKYFKRNIKK